MNYRSANITSAQNNCKNILSHLNAYIKSHWILPNSKTLHFLTQFTSVVFVSHPTFYFMISHRPGLTVGLPWPPWTRWQATSTGCLSHTLPPKTVSFWRCCVCCWANPSCSWRRQSVCSSLSAGRWVTGKTISAFSQQHFFKFFLLLLVSLQKCLALGECRGQSSWQFKSNITTLWLFVILRF